MVWVKHFFVPVFIPTVGCIICSVKAFKRARYRLAGTALSFVIGSKLYVREFSDLDLETERAIRVMEVDSPIGHECREILYNYEPNHWILKKYDKLSKINNLSQQLKQKKNDSNDSNDSNEDGNSDQERVKTEEDFDNFPHFAKGWYKSRWVANESNYRKFSDIGVESSNDSPKINNISSLKEIDDEIYGKSSFIPEFALPKEDLTYATDRYNNNSNNSKKNNDKNEIAQESRHLAVLRPETVFFGKDAYPEPLAKFIDKEKKDDKNWLEEMGIDNEQTQQELLADVEDQNYAQDCWRLEEDYKRCRLLQRKGKASKSQCQQLARQLKKCRVREHVDEFRGLR